MSRALVVGAIVAVIAATSQADTTLQREPDWHREACQISTVC